MRSMWTSPCRWRWTHHQAGRLEAAETLYLAIIHAQADHAIANHNMGLLAGQLGYHDAALPYLSKALQSAGDESDFHYSYANGLLQAGQPQQALAVIDAALEQGHDSAQAQALAASRAPVAGRCRRRPQPGGRGTADCLFEAGRHAELETAAQALVMRYPASGFCLERTGHRAATTRQGCLANTTAGRCTGARRLPGTEQSGQ